MVNERLFSLLEDGMTALSWQQECAELHAARERCAAGSYFIAFIGQYSAGKSYLINNLLERDLLPRGTVETTPLLTYIRYGTEELARLYYYDGHTEDIALSEVRQIIQSGAGDGRELAAVEYMEVFLTAEILRQGMVMIDTPGINTLIERHEQLLAQSLARASSIVYVMRGTPAAVDIDKLELLAHGGRPISLVRTHCDEINEAEEGYADVVAHDESILVDFGIREKIEGCFYLSNLKDTPHFAGIARLRNLLAAKGADVRRSLAVDTELYLRATAGGVIAALGEMEEILAVGQAERAAEIAQKRKSLDEEVARLTETLDVRRAHVKKKAAACRQKMERGIREEIRTAAHQASERIAAAGEETATDEQMKALLQQEMRHVLRHIYDRISELAAPLLKEINSFELPHGDALPVIDLPETEHYASIVAEQNGAIEDLRREFAVMQANRDEIEMQLMQYDAATLEAMQGELRSLEEELVRISDAYQELGPYIPQMIEVDPGDASGAALGKTIGNILDWAMILIPGPTQAKGAGNIAAKAPKAIEAANQTVSVAAKCRGVLAKAAEAGKKAGITKEQILTVLQKYKEIKETAKDANAPASFLDYITLEYWGGKIGAQFDHPPRYEEDPIYRAEYKEKKRRIEKEQLKKQETMYQRRLEIGLFKNKQEQMEARRKSLVLDAQDVERQIAEQEEALRKDSRRKAMQAWKRACAEQFQAQLQEYLTQTVDDYLGDMEARIETYQAQRFLPIEEKIQEKRAAYDRLGTLTVDAAAEQHARVAEILGALRQEVGA